MRLAAGLAAALLVGVALAAPECTLSVRDLGAGPSFVAANAAQGLKFATEWRQVGPKDVGAWELHCTVTADPPADRAIIVRVSLPLDAVGWTWWDDYVERRTITATGGRYADLISWGEGREGSRYPLAAVTGPDRGVTIAIPLAEPRVYRLAYDAGRRALEAEFDLGLTPETTAFPARADFDLLVYPHDPRWGFRDAVLRYYRIFPEYAARRAKIGGIWVLGLQDGSMACPWDYGMRFDEGGETHAGYDAAHDILPFVYTEPWGRYRSFGNKPTPDHKPRYGPTAPLLPPAELKANVTRDLEPRRPGETESAYLERRDWAQAIMNSAIERRDGSWIWHHWTDEWSPGNWISNVILNPDPKLPEPNRASVTWKYELLPAFAKAKATGGELAGVYLDSVASFIGFKYDNFRREQWQYATIPMVADYEAKAPAQLHAFCNVEFARQVWQRMNARGKLVMANTFRPFMQWFCPLLDMIGAGETRHYGISPDRDYRYLRVYGYHKPMSWMDYGFVDPKVKWADEERGMQRCLFYAVYPGTGGFSDPASYEPSRPLFREYEPMIAWLDEAGWEPVSRATSDTADVLVERYGPGATQVAFVAVRNAGKKATSAQVSVERSVLPRGELIAWRMVGDGPEAISGTKSVRFGLKLAPDSTEVVAFGTREDVAGLWLAQAQQWLSRTVAEGEWVRKQAASVVNNGDFEQGLAGWGVDTHFGHGGEIVADTKSPLSGKQSLEAVSRADDAFQSISQGVSLAAGDYILRFRYRWQRPEGKKGAVSARFGVQDATGKWVSDKYVYFRDLKPTGDTAKTYEAHFIVPAAHSAKFFQFLFNRDWGTAWIDDVQVTSTAIEEARRQLVDVAARARDAAAKMKSGLASSKTTADLLRLATAQRPVYEALTKMAAELPDDLTRRRIALPVSDFAEAIGRGVEVLTGETIGLQGKSGPLWCDVPTGVDSKVAIAAPRGATVMSSTGTVEGGVLTMKAPAKALGASSVGTQWEDIMLQASFRAGGQDVWLPRRLTARLHPPLEVGEAEPVSPVSRAVVLHVKSWVHGPVDFQDAQLLAPAGRGGSLPLGLGSPNGYLDEVLLPVPERGWLESMVGTTRTLKLDWTANIAGDGQRKGQADVELVSGAKCPKMAVPPVIDGKIGADEWKGAAKLAGLVVAASGAAAARPTTVLVGHDNTHLYVAFECGGQPNPAAKERPHDGPVWEDDDVEAFLQPSHEKAYYHFAVNAAGSQYEAKCMAGSMDAGWSCTWQAKTGRTADGWTVEMAIPISSLTAGRGLGVREQWRANFGREEADTGEATCWSPTFGGFHVPARFGELLMD